MTERDDEGIFDYLKKRLTSTSNRTEFDRFDFYESEWRVDQWEEAVFGQWRIACFNDERCYRVVIRTKDEPSPEEYVIKLTPYEITNVEDHGDGTKTIDYEFGDDEVARMRDTEVDAKNLGVEIMRTIEHGDWNRRGPGLGSLTIEQKHSSESQ